MNIWQLRPTNELTPRIKWNEGWYLPVLQISGHSTGLVGVRKDQRRFGDLGSFDRGLNFLASVVADRRHAFDVGVDVVDVGAASDDRLAVVGVNGSPGSGRSTRD